jgi:hypothetical protein
MNQSPAPEMNPGDIPKPPAPLSIDAIIDKIEKLPITASEKKEFLATLKDNMLHPERGEIENLNRIQAKYMTPIEPMNYPPIQSGPYGMSGMPGHGIPGYGMPGYGMVSGGMPMTTAHFEILKNKLDSVQLELVDLLRHVKDYTQRYMNAVRQADIEKINSYINGVLEVDKKMQDAKQQAAELEKAAAAEAAPADEEPETRKSIIGRATDGIKNFFGGLGNNVSGITDLVSNTATMANNLLSKPVLGSGAETSNTAAGVSSNTTNNTIQKGPKNIVSVDDYISNMNQIEGSGANTTTNANAISNMNMINQSGSQPQNQSKNQAEMKENGKGNDVELENAINSLNAKINDDIDNTIKKQEQAKQPPQQSGGSRTVKRRKGNNQYHNSNKTRLATRIELLKMRLTKKRLTEQLKGKVSGKTHKRK